MLCYSERRRLTEKYEVWCRENDALNCPFNVITFLVGKGLLDEEKALELIKDGDDNG